MYWVIYTDTNESAWQKTVQDTTQPLVIISSQQSPARSVRLQMKSVCLLRSQASTIIKADQSV